MKRVASLWSTYLSSLLVVAVLLSKTLHISQHFSSLRLSQLLCYLPTLFVQDAIVIFLGVILLRRRRGTFFAVLNIVGGALVALSLVATSIQLGLYLATGSEVDWVTGFSFIKNPSGMKVLMSGKATMYRAGAVMISAALPLCWQLHLALRRNRLLWQITRRTFMSVRQVQRIQRNGLRVPLPVVAVLALALLQWSRPAVPWDHLCDSIPIVVFKAWSEARTSYHPNHQRNSSTFKGALFGLTWLDDSDRPLPGIDCWLDNEGNIATTADFSGANPSFCNTQQHRYRPLEDPLKISNLDLDILFPLQQTFRESSVNITHVVLLTLESIRKDVFPIRRGSAIYEQILGSQDADQKDPLDAVLARLTPVAHMVTGESFSEQPEENSELEHHMGGINVQGAVTGATYTVKSLLGSHCGVGAMPYDFLPEIDYDIYQPCVPHILNLFNRMKGYSISPRKNGEIGPVDVHHRPWTSAFLQSVESSAWGQGIQMDQMGFHTFVDSGTIEDERSKYYPPKSPTLNYFGYAEGEIKPYLRDIMHDAVNNKRRLFLSHLTSTTHHPWNVPPSFEKKKYMGSHGNTDHVPLNDYLNALQYGDRWLGEILDCLDEVGMTNQTLVVMVGDHGYPFPEDTKKWGVTSNPHITAFRVPLVFRHPHLPRIQLSVNATSLSILPTILDLLIQSGSLDRNDTAIASSLIPQYQGQSLLRPFRSAHKGREGWNIAVVAPGGSLLSISSAVVPYRLIAPLAKDAEYRFTNHAIDPAEIKPLTGWTLDEIRLAVHDAYGPKVASWVDRAAEVGEWWLEEQDRLWNIHGVVPSSVVGRELVRKAHS
ncbi:sulfatase domain-containing protein [Rhexocercosporidium sp. MPI-PUGE-AT-0058]|nr:sulfatase domain-containing protein [Rhexocercosporidium sp. MPI-PUGE-AT-0058]